MEFDCSFTKDNKWFRYRVAAIIIEDGCVLFAGNEDAVVREVYEETGIRYDIDHLAVIQENFFCKNSGILTGLDCHEICLYYLMSPKGSKQLFSDSFINV